MTSRPRAYAESPSVKTKIIATIGPASRSEEQLRNLAVAGVDIFRLNFAHANHAELKIVVDAIRILEGELGRPLGILADLSGPKIRLGELPGGELKCIEGEQIQFVREPAPEHPEWLTCTYEKLIDDVAVGDRMLLADGVVSLRVLEKPDNGGSIRCVVEQEGLIRSRQGINLPGVALSTPALTQKDTDDLAWALSQQIDFIGLSFVRKAEDIRWLKQEIGRLSKDFRPTLVAKIEKMEAVSELDSVLDETDAVMVARGDLGVEVDIVRVPSLQKRIIQLCNQHRIPVITATQMLDSMQRSELPTRAEVSDVANAVLDGSDAVMLSGETAIGVNPGGAVSMMSRIALEAEKLIPQTDWERGQGTPRTRALLMTEAVTAGAGAAVELLNAELVVVASRTGRTAMAISKQRLSASILALTDNPQTARRMTLYWGVTPVLTKVVSEPPSEILKFVESWGRKNAFLQTGSRVVLVGKTRWQSEPQDMMIVHVLP